MKPRPSVTPLVSPQTHDLETVATADGRALVIEHGVAGRRYRLGDRAGYQTDAGTLIDGVLVWGVSSADVYLPNGGRRRERTNLRAPQAIVRELAKGAPLRVFFQRLGALWALERPGSAVIVLDERGHPVEVAQLRRGQLGEPIPERPWALLSEAEHVGRIALWAQIEAKLGGDEATRALAEQVRVAAFFVAELPLATLEGVLGHPALAGLALGRGGGG